MSKKPLISCPHCEAEFEAKNLLQSRLYRNKHGIDVFKCPVCEGRIKIDTVVYMVTKGQIEDGEVPEDTIVEAVKEEDFIPQEMFNKSSGPGIGTVAIIVIIILFIFLII